MNFLNTPITINQLELPNRLVLPPMATAISAPDGTVTPSLCDYYSEKSSGGYIGLIITEHSYILPNGRASERQLSIANDSDIDGLKILVDAVHKNNTKIMAQISHAGAVAKPASFSEERWSASPINIQEKNVEKERLPQEMSHLDIQKIIEHFTSAALRAKKAGYDGVEIHSAHGYLLNQFYSPLSNIGQMNILEIHSMDVFEFI